MRDDKRFYRKLKKQVKKIGNRKRRATLKKQLEDNPTEAHWDEFDFGATSSQSLNKADSDATRKRKLRHGRPTDQ